MRAAGGGGADAVGVNTDCVDYEGDAKTVHLGKTFVVVGRDGNPGACPHGVF